LHYCKVAGDLLFYKEFSLRIRGFDWNERNINHIARHGVTPQEVEESCFNQLLCRKTKLKLYLVYSQTDAGRYLLTVLRLNPLNIAYTITARGMTDREQKYYRQER
jgi:uncharacterized DUF497 family protein